MNKIMKVALVKSPLFFFLSSAFLFSSAFDGIAQGCTDPLAINFNSNAISNDGSCIYPPMTIQPVLSWDLPSIIQETSGLLEWNNLFWTHNDNSDLQLYGIDTVSVLNPQVIGLQHVANYDWEEITQDAEYLYLGDFGNNTSGNRTDLRIYRILKSSISTLNQLVDTIDFSYEDQTVFTPNGANNTDFDCEAFIVSTDSIYLFTKQWVGHQTVVYSLPKSPGNYIAQKKEVFNADGLITGASFIESEQLLLLSGYSQYLQPFVWLFYDFQENDFFGANKRKVSINLPFHQIESISTQNGLNVMMSNERFQQSALIIDQQLHQFDFTDLIQPYLTAQLTDFTNEPLLSIYPNPAFTSNLTVHVANQNFPLCLSICDQKGQHLYTYQIASMNDASLDVQLDMGVYFIQLSNQDGFTSTVKWLKF